MRSLRRLPTTLALVATLILVANLPLAAATPYPNHVIKMILPFPPGSTTDNAARYLAEELRKSLGQPVIMENIVGADGNIAVQNAKRSAPDGHTLLVSTNSAHGVNRAIYNQLPFDPERDFEPVGGLIRIPQMLCVRSDFPATDVAGFVKVANERAAKKPLSYGSGNTSSRVTAELMKATAKIEMLHVPYRGMPQALQDLLAGEIDVLFVDPFLAQGFVKNGQIKALAVADKAHVPLLPDVPTAAEAGYEGIEVVSWAAVFVPAKTDPAIVELLNKTINESLAQPDAREYFERMGGTTMLATTAELRSFVSSEIARWAKLAEIAGIPKK
jgi:tripartite-type tricarboxylate transporter receptor subunit TctC